MGGQRLMKKHWAHQRTQGFPWGAAPPLGIIAREISLDVSDSAYAPDLGEHIPGIANKAADVLSRMHEPGRNAILPHDLPRELEAHFPTRVRAWWRALPAEP